MLAQTHITLPDPSSAQSIGWVLLSFAAVLAIYFLGLRTQLTRMQIKAAERQAEDKDKPQKAKIDGVVTIEGPVSYVTTDVFRHELSALERAVQYSKEETHNQLKEIRLNTREMVAKVEGEFSAFKTSSTADRNALSAEFSGLRESTHDGLTKVHERADKLFAEIAEVPMKIVQLLGTTQQLAITAATTAATGAAAATVQQKGAKA